LDIPRQVLDERIARRVAGMFDAGLVDEVRSLLARGLREGPTAARALGYPQVVDLIDGVVDQGTAMEQIVAATRSYARRQQRWFRRDPRTVWLPVVEGPVSTASAIAARRSALRRTLGP
jgi:tRNA dimethylallyltransferase